jgi:hypothetical protein
MASSAMKEVFNMDSSVRVQAVENLGNKRCCNFFQETLLNSVSDHLLPLMVGQSHDSLTQLSVEDVMLF